MAVHLTTAEVTSALRGEAAALGFNRVGVIPAGAARRLDAYLRWIAAGQHGEMGYMARPDRVERRRDPGVILPGVRSVIVVGLDYHTAELPRAGRRPGTRSLLQLCLGHRLP